MARADLLTALVKFGTAGDKARFQKVVESIIAEERAKKHTVLAEKLEDLLRSTPVSKPVSNGTATLDHRISNFVHEVIPNNRVRVKLNANKLNIQPYPDPNLTELGYGTGLSNSFVSLLSSTRDSLLYSIKFWTTVY